MSSSILIGKKEIAGFVKRSWNRTILHWIDNDSFPAKKIDGIWMSDKTLIIEWIKKKLRVDIFDI